MRKKNKIEPQYGIVLGSLSRNPARKLESEGLMGRCDKMQDPEIPLPENQALSTLKSLN